MEVTFGKGSRDEVWNLSHVHLLVLRAPKDTA